MAQEMIKYAGNCHCGAFKFTAELPDIKKGTTCNCSICVKKAYLCETVQEEEIEILRGEGILGVYVFGKEGWAHEFCKICGTPVWVRKSGRGEGGTDEFALNIRTLIDVDPFALDESEKLDAIDLPPTFVPPPFKGELPFVEGETEKLKTYTGACHCGAVTLAIKSLPLPEAEVMEDNCSICVRNGNTFVYPLKQHVSISGSDNLTPYLFANRMAAHRFCKVCGVHVCIDLTAPPKEVWDGFPEHVKEVLSVKLGQVPVRIAVLEGVEWEDLKVIRRSPGTAGYVVD